jgi:aminoglycoside phosphotransferase family enzyme
MAWVFLTETRAYKLKKPVRYAYLDYLTPEARRWACGEEVRLNRRLAPDVYLGVLPLTDTPEGLRVAGDGPAVDWLVEMRRLAADRMLDRRILSGALRPGEPRGAAALLARFYRAAPPVEMTAADYRDEIERTLLASRHALLDPRDGLPAAVVEEAVDAALRLVRGEPALLDARVAAGRIVEGHGDLRPEHIALGPVPAVIDCLEFDRRLRLLDPADELSFLILECERLGARWAGELVLSEYRRLTGDAPPARLLALYGALRALVRAKLALWHLREPRGEPARWTALARRYALLARERARAIG